MLYRIFFPITLFVFSSFLLSGCTTQEVKKDDPINTSISLDKEKQNTESSLAPPEKQDKNISQEKKALEEKKEPLNQISTKKMYTTKPEMMIDTTKEYSVTMKTSKGDIVIALDAKNTPLTVNNFIFLAKEKFYDNTIFHRTIKNFMIQGGDPTGTGMGGPGYQFADESFTGEYTRGTLAMANAGPNTNGSQFFIMHKDTPLPKNYVIFGHVTAGMDIVDMIAEAPTKSGGEGSSPVEPVSIQTMIVSEK